MLHVESVYEPVHFFWYTGSRMRTLRHGQTSHLLIHGNRQITSRCVGGAEDLRRGNHSGTRMSKF